MRRLCLLVLLAGLAGVGAVPARADGMILAPAFTLRGIRETTQTAFIEVRRDHSVLVDMYIGVRDESGKGRPIIFAVPFFSKPQQFSANEVAQREIKRRSARADEILRQYWSARARLEQAPARLIPLFSVLCTPASPALFVAARKASQRGQTGGGETYTTEHSRIEIIETTTRGDLGALAKRYGLPEQAMQAISRYLGKPVAIITIRPLPARTGPVRDSRVIASQPVLHLRFAQQMRRWRYDADSSGWKYAYPLGTGAAWAKPISRTEIYVVADARLNIVTDFPDEGGLSSYASSARVSPRVARAADGHLQVHWAEYTPHNQDRDVSVALPDRWRSDLPAHTRRVKWGYPVVKGLAILMAIASWLAAFALVRWRLPWPGVPFGRACCVVWLLGVGLPAIPVAAVIGALGEYGRYQIVWHLMDTAETSGFACAAATAIFCAGVALLAVLSARAEARRWRLASAVVLLAMAILAAAAFLALCLQAPADRVYATAIVEDLIMLVIGMAVGIVATIGVVWLARRLWAKRLGSLDNAAVLLAALSSTLFYLAGSAALTILSLWLLNPPW